MTLRGLLAVHRPQFYRQDWYWREAFLDTEVSPLRAFPCGVRTLGQPPEPTAFLVPAASLVAAYLERPDNWIWSRYLWTADTDAKGQRVYIGGVGPHNGHTLEIHRHLHLTAQWGTPIFI